MNQSRGKASTNASRQNKSQKSSQASKTQTNASPQRRNNTNQRKRKANLTYNLAETQSKRGRIGLSSESKSVSHRQPQIIEEDEYISEVNGSVNFTRTVYPVNIGQASTFPWGSKIASLFEKYKFLMLEFYYKREVSEFATNGQTGKVMLSFDYDATDSFPTNKQQVMDTIPHVDSMPCAENIFLRIDCSKFDWLYVRPGIQPNNTDLKTYDCGQFFQTTQGCASSALIGELHVRYRCLVQTPILDNPSLSNGSVGSTTEFFSRVPETITSSTTPQVAFSVVSPAVVNNGANLTLAPSGLITLPNGVYKISCQVVATANAVDVSALTIMLCQVITPATQVVIPTNDDAAVQSFIAGLNGHRSYFCDMYEIIWDTGQFGPFLTAQITATFSSGACSAKTRLLFEYLGTT